MTSSEVREQLVGALRLDLVGPHPGDPYQDETLSQAPSRWYLTGFLVPFAAKEDQRTDPTSTEQIEVFEKSEGTDDDQTPESASARKVFFPASIGVSVLLSARTRELQVHVTWGDYKLEAAEEAGALRWTRTPRQSVVPVRLGDERQRREVPVPESKGLKLAIRERPVPKRVIGGEGRVPQGTRSVSIFLVNEREPQGDDRKDEASAFQAGLTIQSDTPFVPRPNLRGLELDDQDERIADLQYRDACEYAVGHGVATTALVVNGACREVRTAWVPTADVERVEPGQVDGVDLSMEALGAVASFADLKSKVEGLVLRYADWIKAQETPPPGDKRREEVATELLNRANGVRKRMAEGLAALDDPTVLDAFRTANRAMAAAARQRESQVSGKDPKLVAAPRWHPFQLAFLLMNVRGVVDPSHGDREIVDLLFFPTGGGKTEAYLGLAAFTLVLRRLRHPGVEAAGVTVLMRYTLRLLTLDQLGRAAALICALELERKKDKRRLGDWPFEVGLWVGKGATPNRMGRRGDNDKETARAKTIAYQNNSRKASPIPLENCPWCGAKFKPVCFRLTPNENLPTDLRITCANRSCPFSQSDPLPVVAVDEPLYRRLPCFVIATVDKFAGLPWFGRVGALFGKVDRYDANGFYGPSDPDLGRRLEKPLLPPDLIVQDELHLISGPLGTLVGLYETAIDALCTREEGEARIRPKVVASTATIRRAPAQVRALFARRDVEVFPAPGPDRRDSFFARTVPPTKANARRYVGIAAQGRSLKVLLLRSYLALLGAAQKAYAAAGGDRNRENPADPYMTLLGYFGSLRELGGSRRIVEDEVSSRVSKYAGRRREGDATGLFEDREIDYEVTELTSRESTDKVANARRRLALRFFDEEAVDVALATNMISVGLDITRLGLMVVLGQPKATAEYIQATSRVGRDPNRPGLVVTLLNIHRPRDRSHYERFEAYHASFYRAVEATSVTPFAPRAIDRGLAAVAVGLARHGLAAITAADKARDVRGCRGKLDFVGETLAERAAATSTDGDPPRGKVVGRVNDLLDDWKKIADGNFDTGSPLHYNATEDPRGPALLVDPLDPDLLTIPLKRRKFKAHRSLRDVEPSVNLWVVRFGGGDVEEGEE